MSNLRNHFVFVLLGIVRLFAQAPGNDLRENATVIDLSTTARITGNFVGATAGDDPHGTSFFPIWSERSLWYRIDSDKDQVIQITNLTSDNPQSILVAFKVDEEPYLEGAGYVMKSGDTVRDRSVLSLKLKKDEVYFLLVGDRFSQDPSPFSFSLKTITQEIPANDDFENALDLGTNYVQDIPGTLYNASMEPGEDYGVGTFIQGNLQTASVWYRWTAPRTGKIGFSAVHDPRDGYDYPLVEISMYGDYHLPVGRLYSLRLTPGAEEEIQVEGGRTYLIAAEREAPTEKGRGFTFSLLDLEPPANDRNENASWLPGDEDFFVQGTTRQATMDRTESVILNTQSGGAAVWYQWEVPSTGIYEITLGSLESTMDVAMLLFEGANVAASKEKLWMSDTERAKSRIYLEAGSTWTFLAFTSGMNNSALGTRATGRFDLTAKKLAAEPIVAGDRRESPRILTFSGNSVFEDRFDISEASASGDDPTRSVSFPIIAGSPRPERNIWYRLIPEHGGYLGFLGVVNQEGYLEIRVYEERAGRLVRLPYASIQDPDDENGSAIGAAKLKRGRSYLIELISAEGGIVNFAAQIERASYQLFQEFHANANSLNNPLDDDDGDGFSNLEEYALVSNPFDKSDRPTGADGIINLAQGRIKFPGFGTQDNLDLSYSLETSTSLSGAWTKIEDAKAETAEGGGLVFPLSDQQLLVGEKRFFRMKAVLRKVK